MPAHPFETQQRVECGLECPRYLVPLRLPTPTAEPPFEFILDTGADVSLIPIDFAEHFHIQYDRDEVTEAQPVTLTGRLAGHTGLLNARLRVAEAGIDVAFPLPCFFYQSSATTSATTGTPARRMVVRPPGDLDEWEARTLGSTEPAPTGKPLILGRLGFLSRFRVLLHHDRFLLATDNDSLREAISAAPAPPRKPRRRR
jgi:hypothetical protein